MRNVSTATAIEEDRPPDKFAGIVGNSPALKSLLTEVERVAATDATVVVLGETGTGKELIARAIHELSPRSGRPFIKLNCAAIPLHLLESELFGYERGAFTGAFTQRIGRFEMADTGTLFLDEVGDIPLALQPKLLRVLQEKEFERLGSGKARRVDVRVVVATHRNLWKMVLRKQFRADLYYRLNVYPMALPPLRERREDIPLLISHFVKVSAQRMGKQISNIPNETLDAFASHSWPGNVRELQNVIERAVILSENGVLANSLPPVAAKSSPIALTSPPKGVFWDSQREWILQALDKAGWIIGGPRGAAARLGLKRTTLISKMKKLGIARPVRQPDMRGLHESGEPERPWQSVADHDSGF